RRLGLRARPVDQRRRRRIFQVAAQPFVLLDSLDHALLALVLAHSVPFRRFLSSKLDFVHFHRTGFVADGSRPAAQRGSESRCCWSLDYLHVGLASRHTNNPSAESDPMLKVNGFSILPTVMRKRRY